MTFDHSAFEDRGRALEEAFFKQRDQQLMEKLRGELQSLRRQPNNYLQSHRGILRDAPRPDECNVQRAAMCRVRSVCGFEMARPMV